MKYRAEIDGLRALAVVPVILFHAGFEVFSGGFVGVDIFFVISGYLITTIIIEDMEKDRFSIVTFYERRARRILPALYIMLLVVGTTSTIIMLPSQLKDFGQSLMATVLFSSNIFFYLKADYWAQSSEFLPLLHTWSLGVEEQFYIIFPIFLILVWRFGKSSVFWMILLFATISLMASEWGWRNQASANFYLAPTRAWELLAGSMAAFYVHKHGVLSSNAFSLLGFVAIVVAILVYDDTTPFPSVYGLLPILGVLLVVIFADRETIVAKLLSTKIFVGVGLISYSAYLWHQPLLALGRVYLFDKQLPNSLAFLLILATFLIAFFSYRVIESPFRNKEIISRKALLYFSGLPLILYFAYGGYLHFSEGLRDMKRSSLGPESRIAFERLEDTMREGGAFRERALKDAMNQYGENKKVKLLLIGDSLSEDLFVASSLDEQIKSTFDIRQMAFDDECAKNLVTDSNEMNHDGFRCADSRSNLFNSEIFRQSKILIIANGWLSNAKYLENLLNVPEVSQKKVIVYKTHSFADISSMILALDDLELSYEDTKYKQFLYLNKHTRTLEANKILEAIAKSYSFHSFDAYEVFCDDLAKSCSLFSEKGYPLLIDQAHLSAHGLETLAPWLAKNLEKIMFEVDYRELDYPGD